MITKQVLREARSLIKDPTQWTQSVEARDADGNRVNPSAPAAVCWCASGAIARVLGVYGWWEAQTLLIKEYLDDPKRQLWEINDENGHSAVLLALDEMIERAPEGTS